MQVNRWWVLTAAVCAYLIMGTFSFWLIEYKLELGGVISFMVNVCWALLFLLPALDYAFPCNGDPQ